MALIELNLRPNHKQLRIFGLVGAILFGLVGVLIRWRGGFLFWHFPASAPAVATVLWIIGGLCLLDSALGYVGSKLHPCNQLVYWIITLVGYPIGFVLSFVLMGVLFYGMLTPLGLFFRLIGRDPLYRRFDRTAKTYWEDHKAPADVSRYYKQF